MIRLSALTLALAAGCATPQSRELPSTSELCERLSRASNNRPFGQFYRCRLEGQTCIVLLQGGNVAMDCEDDED